MAADGSLKRAFAYTTVGLQLAVTLLVFVYAGHKLDIRFNTEPWYLIAGVVVGMVLGFYNLFKELGRLEREPKPSAANRKRRKWL